MNKQQLFVVSEDAQEKLLAPDDVDWSHVKTQINNLIWMHAHAYTTLIEAEDMACKMFEIIREGYEAHHIRGKQQCQNVEQKNTKNT